MKSLKEAILQDPESVINNNNLYKTLYPIPASKDFKKNPWGEKSQYIVWDCKDIIQAYIAHLELPEFNLGVNKGDACGFRVDINSDKTIETSIIFGGKYSKVDLTGVGDWISNSLPAVKKEVLNFFKYMQEHPESVKVLFEFATKSQREMEVKGMVDCKQWSQILKY
jgi:hypothetical protein